MSARPVTIKLGGVAGQHEAGVRLLATSAPPGTVIVHGGGGEVADWSRRLGLQPRTHDGLRVTDPATLEVVVAVLGGLINTRLVAMLGAAGRSAIGLTGADARMLRLRRRVPDIGEVGEVVGVDGSLLESLAAAGALPVIAPVGLGPDGELLNVNADEVAGALGAARGGLLLLCTDVAGVRLEGRVLDRLDPDAAESMLADGSASDGMRPKLRAALTAARAGCDVRIIDGRSAADVERALAGEPAGTAVTAA